MYEYYLTSTILHKLQPQFTDCPQWGIAPYFVSLIVLNTEECQYLSWHTLVFCLENLYETISITTNPVTFPKCLQSFTTFQNNVTPWINFYETVKNWTF